MDSQKLSKKTPGNRYWHHGLREVKLWFVLLAVGITWTPKVGKIIAQNP